MSEVSGGGTAFSTAVVLSSLAKPPDGSSAVRRHCSLDVLVYHISLSIPPIRRLLHYGKQALSPRSGHEPDNRSYTLLVKLCWQMPDLNKSSLYFPVWGLSWSVVGSLRKRFPLARENRCMIIPRNAQRDMHSAEMACEPAS